LRWPFGAKTAPQAGANPPRAHALSTKDAARSQRFTVLAASVAVAAAIGAGAGALGVVGLVQFFYGQPVALGNARAAADETRALKEVVAQLNAEVGAVKAGIEQANKANSTQLGRLADRLERAERQQAEPAAKITKALESLERLERRTAAAPTPPQPEVTGAIPSRAAEAAAPKRPIIENWTLRRVYDGIALLQGRRGVVEVEAGDVLSGAGRVREIKREDGRWIVVTSRGIIVPR
jgi:hypothetical protein